MPASRHEVPDLPLFPDFRTLTHRTRADRPADGRLRAARVLGRDGRVLHLRAAGERGRS
ncbi:hypothetical protein [Streptomyces sp. NPDC047985]|uniref:hypothetical protein n=1 Tax=unclassified Streptomyces TaxID=2593676 RepID=UPI00341AC5C5